jgi:hypothetical protein
MNPVVGLDVSKGESEVQGFLEKGKPYGKSFSIKHDIEGLEKLLVFLKGMKELTAGSLRIYRKLGTRLKELYKNGSKKWIDDKAQLLKEAATRNPFQKNLYQSHLLSMGIYINIFCNIKSIYQYWKQR